MLNFKNNYKLNGKYYNNIIIIFIIIIVIIIIIITIICVPGSMTKN